MGIKGRTASHKSQSALSAGSVNLVPFYLLPREAKAGKRVLLLLWGAGR